jgi:hypothetical protein
MPNDLEKVQSGDLIEASLYNDLVDRIRSLEKRVGDVPDTLVEVPDLIGLQFGTAVSTVEQPNVQLQVGTARDVTGALVDPDLAKNKPRRVVGQTPEPGRTVGGGTVIKFLIASPVTSGGGDGDGRSAPEIEGFTPSSQHIGSIVNISGENLSGNQVSVQIDGKSASLNRVTPIAIDARVPTSIPEPPEGQPRTVPVEVTVDGQSDKDTTSFSVKPKKQKPKPSVSGLDTTRYTDDNRGNKAAIGTKIVILGENFADDPSKVTVRFERDGRTKKVTPEAARTKPNAKDELDIIVPDLGIQSSDSPPYRVIVEGASESDKYANLTIFRPPN